MTRNPARFQIVVLFCLYFIFIFFLDRWLNARSKKTSLVIGVVTLSWALAMSNLIKTNLQMPVFNYREGYPWSGIEAMKKSPPGTLMTNLPVEYVPNQFANFASMVSGVKQIMGYVSYTLLTEKRLGALQATWGDLVRISCREKNPDVLKRISISTSKLDPFIDEMLKAKIRFITLQQVPGDCPEVLNFISALKASPRVTHHETFLLSILEIKK